MTKVKIQNNGGKEMENKQVVTRKEHLEEIDRKLGCLMKSKAGAIPKDLNQSRFMQNTMFVLTETEGIEKLDAASIARTMLQGAFLGLDFLNKECYAIPYAKKLNFQTDYKGDVKLAKKYSINPIKDIYAKLVKEGDEFEELVRDGRQTIMFTPKPFNDADTIGVFAVALFKDGSMMVETLSKKDVEKVRTSYSTAQNSKAWVKSPGEMYKKTALKRLTKHISLEFPAVEQQVAWDESSDMDFKKKDAPQTAASSLDEEMINITPKEKGNETNQEKLL